jgi:hypothetical protein
MKRWHRWPRIHESVIDSERDDRGPYGRGLIIHVDRDGQSVLVRFFQPPEAHHARYVLAYAGDILWQGCPGGEPHYVDLNARSEVATVDELISTQYYEFDDLRWSSHDGGVGAWITRSYNP